MVDAAPSSCRGQRRLCDVFWVEPVDSQADTIGAPGLADRCALHGLLLGAVFVGQGLGVEHVFLLRDFIEQALTHRDPVSFAVLFSKDNQASIC